MADPQTRLTLLYLTGAMFVPPSRSRSDRLASAVAGFFVVDGIRGLWTSDPAWLAKRNGRVAFWMLPYAAAAWMNSRLWTRAEPAGIICRSGMDRTRAFAPQPQRNKVGRRPHRGTLSRRCTCPDAGPGTAHGRSARPRGDRHLKTRRRQTYACLLRRWLFAKRHRLSSVVDRVRACQ